MFDFMKEFWTTRIWLKLECSNNYSKSTVHVELEELMSQPKEEPHSLKNAYNIIVTTQIRNMIRS